MKKFIITGIQMRNKGSQAMFLSLYYALKSIYPDSEIVGFSNKYDTSEQYSFKLLPYDDYTRKVFKYRLNEVPFLAPVLTSLASQWKKSDKWDGKIVEMEKALEEANAIFDASGYTLGSGWSMAGGGLLLQTIELAKRYGKPIVLMPQSFGPFDWDEEGSEEFLKQVKEDLSYCTKIFARELEGYDCLTALGLDNVELSTDLVIREKFFPSASDIYAPGETREVSYPAPDSVGFIINENVFRIGEPDVVLDLYAQMLDKLVDDGEKVCVLTTSTADIEPVGDVLKKTRNRDRVEVIRGEYSSPELIDIIARFKYVVASRYHSVVFAYRSGVPAIILGWASKYSDLAGHFRQQDYLFDIREPGVGRILEKIGQMSANHESESRLILECLEKMQGDVVKQAVEALQA